MSWVNIGTRKQRKDTAPLLHVNDDHRPGDVWDKSHLSCSYELNKKNHGYCLSRATHTTNASLAVNVSTCDSAQIRETAVEPQNALKT